MELGSHDIAKPSGVNYKVSYVISIVFCQLMALELVRAWQMVKRCYTKEQLEHKDFDQEVKWMYNSWTSDLKEKEKRRGNTFMVRNRIRWSIFQVIIAGLNTFETA